MNSPQTMNTLIICPACNGTKTDKMSKLSCQWCKGKKTVLEETAKGYDDSMRRMKSRAAFEGH